MTSILSKYDLGAPFTAKDSKACGTSCDAHPTCRGWTFNPSKMCQLKKEFITFPQKDYASGKRTSALQPVLDIGSDRTIASDFDIVGAVSKVKNVAECQAKCNAHPTAKGWTLNPSKMCQLKSEITAFRKDGYTSGKRTDAALKAGYDRLIPSAYNVGSEKKYSSWSGCQEACRKTDACKAWTYTPDGKCQFKSTEAYQYKDKFVSGGRWSSITREESVPATTVDTTDTPGPVMPDAPPPPPDFFQSNKTMIIGGGALLVVMMMGCGMMMVMSSK